MEDITLFVVFLFLLFGRRFCSDCSNCGSNSISQITVEITVAFATVAAVNTSDILRVFTIFHQDLFLFPLVHHTLLNR
jgi:hypothetical protein